MNDQMPCQPSGSTVTTGVSCPGCPHRAAYIACKEALGRGKGRVICGDAGCALVGSMHPAATICPGGEKRLLDRYRTSIPDHVGPNGLTYEACIRFVPDYLLMQDEGIKCSPVEFADEHNPVILAILASSVAYLTRKAIDSLAERALNLGCADVVTVDPFDTNHCSNVLNDMLKKQGIHGVVFSSPCSRLASTGEQRVQPVEIDAYACVGCHRCQQITGCPAILCAPPVFRIDSDACTGCDLCTGYCRTNVIYSPRSRMTPEQRHAARYAAATSHLNGDGRRT